MRPAVSVVIAAHTEERWDSLVRAIESAASQEPAPAALIVAVDHNPALSARLRAAFADVVVVDNVRGRGASGTRNTGAALVTTPLLAFLDDDATAHPAWLDRLLEPFADGEVIGTGGGVDAVWETGGPAWFPDEFGWVVGASYTGMPQHTAPIRNVWSENMAVRRDAFEAVGGFSADFGKVGRTSRPEDTDLCIRIAARGGRWMYVPAARVDHEVPRGRSTLRFFLRRCFWEGRGKVELSHRLAGERDLGSERDYLRRTLPAGVAHRVAAGLRHRRGRDFAQAGSIVAGALAAAAGAAAGLLRRHAAAAGLLALVLAALAAAPSPAATTPSGKAMPVGDLPHWTQTLTEDFTGTTLDQDRWQIYRGVPGGDPGGWFAPSHVRVGGGQLVIDGYRDRKLGNRWATGGIATQLEADQTYGKYLVRMKVDRAIGVNHAILLWPANEKWPPEIDFSESDGRGRKVSYTTLHPSGHPMIHDQVAVDLTRWHTVGVEWTRGKVVYTLDGRRWATIKSRHVPAEPMKLAVQTQAWRCGTSTWAGCVGPRTPEHVHLDVDWTVAYAPRP